MELQVEHVTATAWAVAAMRLAESRRPDAVFHDELTGKLIGGQHQDMMARMQMPVPREREGHMASINMYIVGRTYLIDQMIEHLVNIENVDTVLNMGAGLDTRPYRLNLPSSLRWVEADFASTVDLKNERLAADQPRCQFERIAADLSDDAARAAVLARVAKGAKKMLVLTEGLLPYLPEANVANLANELRALPACRYWMMDYASAAFYSFAVNASQAANQQSTATGATVSLPFRPDDLIAYLEAHNWPLVEKTTIFEASEGLDRLPEDFKSDNMSVHELLRGCGVAVFRPGT